MSDTVDNCTTLQAMIDSQYALLEAEQVLYAALQAQRTVLGTTNPDLASVNNSGEGGAESYTVATVTEQLSQSAARLKELNYSLLELFKTQNARFPWIKTRDHHHRHWGGYPWY